MSGKELRAKVERQLSYGYFAIGHGRSRIYCPDCRQPVTTEHRASTPPTEPLRAALTGHLRDDCQAAS